MKKCSAFWKHTNVRGDNRVFPCCRFKKPVDTFKGSLEDILISDVYEELRNTDVSKMPECAKCMYEEHKGRKSLRQKFNEAYDTDTVGLEYLEIGFDNICNLTCDGCWGEFSSAWSKKLNPDAPKSLHYTSIDEITSVPDTIKKVVFLGGEPLMTSRHEKFLNLVKDPSKVEITYNTNATFMLSEQLISLLKQFKNVHFIVSIDGYKELNEKVRSGTKWIDVLNFIEQVKDNNFSMSINSVLHLNNWHGMPELESFVKTLNVDWELNILTYPLHLDVKNYSDKEEVKTIINATNIPNKEYVLNHLS